MKRNSPHSDNLCFLSCNCFDLQKPNQKTNKTFKLGKLFLIFSAWFCKSFKKIFLNKNTNFIAKLVPNKKYQKKLKKRLDHYDLKPKMFLSHYHFWQKISNN